MRPRPRQPAGRLGDHQVGQLARFERAVAFELETGDFDVAFVMTAGREGRSDQKDPKQRDAARELHRPHKFKTLATTGTRIAPTSGDLCPPRARLWERLTQQSEQIGRLTD